MTTPVLVDIVDVVSGTIKVRADELRKTDVVFDAFGGEYELTYARSLKKGYVRTKRSDGVVDFWAPEDTVTIRRTPTEAEAVAQRVLALWNREGGWIPGCAYQQLADALGLPHETLLETRTNRTESEAK